MSQHDNQKKNSISHEQNDTTRTIESLNRDTQKNSFGKKADER